MTMREFTKALTPAGLTLGPPLMFIGSRGETAWLTAIGLAGAMLLGLGLITAYLEITERRKSE